MELFTRGALGTAFLVGAVWLWRSRAPAPLQPRRARAWWM